MGESVGAFTKKSTITSWVISCMGKLSSFYYCCVLTETTGLVFIFIALQSTAMTTKPIPTNKNNLCQIILDGHKEGACML